MVPGTNPNQPCRVSGTLYAPPHPVKRPYLNGGFQMFSGTDAVVCWPARACACVLLAACWRLIPNCFLNPATGWLDQSWWPDGLYTAPTDDALAFDLRAVKTYGMNIVRLHQKVNPARWYFYADSLGVVVMQDMPQVRSCRLPLCCPVI
jgi:hypothetical protein